MPAIYTNRLRAPLLLSALLLAACGGKDAAPAATDEPAREITLAPSPATPPALADAPAKPEAAPAPAPKKPAPRKAAPVPAAPTTIVRELPPAAGPAPAPAPAPAGPSAAATGILAAGTSLTVHPTGRICTNTHKAGDRFTATLRETVTGSNGATIPAGSTVVFRIVESAKSDNAKDNMRLTYDFVSVTVGDESYSAEATVTHAAPLEKMRVQTTGDQAKKVGAGAAIGAIAGQLLGKNTRSTVIGAVVGGAAGGVVAAGTADYNGCVSADANITVSLGAPLTVKVVGARAPGI